MTATPGSAELLALAEYHEAGCNRYQGNAAGCSMRRCLVRAGWKIGDPVDYSKATCEAHETAVALRLAAKPIMTKSDRQDGDGLLREIGILINEFDASKSDWAFRKYCLNELLDKLRAAPTRDGAEGAAKYLDDLESGMLSRDAPTPSQIAETLRSAPPKPAPDAVRTALERMLAAFKGMMPFPLVVQAVAEGLVRDAEAALAAPVPSPDGAGEHGIQCNLCGETLHDNEICDDAECPIGGSFTVHPSPAVAAEPVALDKYIPDIVKNAMLTMWNEICADTDCHPLDITHGTGKILWFTPHHWAEMTGDMVARNIADLYSSPTVRRDREALETMAAGAIIDVMMGGKFDWRSRIDDSDFLESADWQQALLYARAVLSIPVQPGAGERDAFNHDDVVRLVLAARTVAFGDDHGGEEGMRELDLASEQFAASIPWADQPSEDEL